VTLAPGAKLGPHEVVSLLGTGGMGEVYRARDPRLAREVAVKVLPEEFLEGEERRQRFEREAKLLASLNHPNIAAIYSFEEIPGSSRSASGPRHLLVMELVEGDGLDVRIASGPLPLEEILSLGTQIAEALCAAHEKSIVHRDLKPANVRVTSGGLVKLLDFGIARASGAEGGAPETEETLAKLTQAGTIVGTIPYMSPEQIEARPLDHRTDLFSLGVVLYEMATGERPFSGDSSPALMSSILRDEPKPVSRRRPGMPNGLSHLVSRCLEKQPGDRIQTANEILAELKALRRALESGGTASVPAPRDGAASIAVLPFADLSAAKDQDWFCEGMAEEIMNALVGIGGIRVASRTSAFQARRKQADLAAVGRALSVGHVLEGSVRTSGNRLRVTAQLTDVASGFQLWSERFDRNAEDVFAVQDEIAAGVVAAVSARLAPGERAVRVRLQVANLEAYRHYLMGRHLRYTKNDHGNARRSFQQAVALDPSHAASWVALAEIEFLVAFYGLIPARAAAAAARTALATAATLQGESAEALCVEGMLAFGEWRWAAAERALNRAIELEPDNVRARCWCGILLSSLGRPDEAAAMLDHAREVDPLASYPRAMTGFCLLAAGRVADAERHLDEALTFEAGNILALWTSGVALTACGRHAEGIARLDTALTPPSRGSFVHGALGWALATAGRCDEARDVLEEMRARPASAPAIVSECWLLAALGETDAAWEALERAENEGAAALALTGLPGFDLLRGDPRFAALQKRMGLTP
jgi:serine/threonine-protein kinase